MPKTPGEKETIQCDVEPVSIPFYKLMHMTYYLPMHMTYYLPNLEYFSQIDAKEHHEMIKNDQQYKNNYETSNSTFRAQVQLKVEENIKKMNELKLIKNLPELEE